MSSVGLSTGFYQIGEEVRAEVQALIGVFSIDSVARSSKSMIESSLIRKAKGSRSANLDFSR
jgi:hypothetical protein